LARESGVFITGPLFVLVGCCAFIGLFPTLISPILTQAILDAAPGLISTNSELVSMTSLGSIQSAAIGLVIVITATALVFRLLLKTHPYATGPTWGCGFAAPTVRMQYTSSSFAQMLVGIFAWALRPHTHLPGRLELFPQRREFQSHVPDTVLEGVLPAFTFSAWLLTWARVFQGGRIHVYLLYIFVTLLVLLICR
jgi:hydrogenase-4 component B